MRALPGEPTKILCWQERIFLRRNLRALRGFAANPGLDFHREGAKHAKKTRRTLVWLRLCCSVFIGGSILCSSPGHGSTVVIIARAALHGREPGHCARW